MKKFLLLLFLLPAPALAGDWYDNLAADPGLVVATMAAQIVIRHYARQPESCEQIMPVVNALSVASFGHGMAATAGVTVGPALVIAIALAAIVYEQRQAVAIMECN